MRVISGAANEAFCASPKPPSFGPRDVQGQIVVRIL